MECNIDLVSYMIRQKYSKSFVNIKQKCQVGRPIFPDTRERNLKHIVVVDEFAVLQFISRSEYPLVLFVGIEPDCIQSVPCNYIALPDGYSVAEVFNSVNAIFDVLENWYQELEDSVNVYYSYNNILNSCETLIDVPIALLDTQFRYISYTKRLAYLAGFDRYVQKNIYLPLEDINYMNSLPDYKGLEKMKGVFHYVAVENLLHKNVFYNGEYIARLSISYDEDEITKRFYTAILEVLCEYIERLYAQFGTFRRFEKLESMWKETLIELLEKKYVDQSVLDKYLADKNYQKSDEYVLVQFTSGFTNNNEDTANALASRLELQNPGVTCVRFQGMILALVNITHYERKKNNSFTQRLSYYLRDSLLQAGVSREFQVLNHMPAAFRQSQIALEYGTILDNTLWCYRFNDYAFNYILKHGSADFMPEQICHKGILRLMEYDETHNTSLNQTLRVYMEQGYNASETARALFINRSSFLKRLDRIQTLTGIQIEEFKTRTYLAISYHILAEYGR